MATEQQIPTLAGAIVSKQAAFKPLPTDDTQWAIENPEAAIALAVEAIRNRNKTPLVSPQKRVLTPWKTISIGGTTVKKLIERVDKEQNLSNYAKNMMNNEAFTVAKATENADLVILSIKDLGFTSNPRTDEFMTAEFCAEWSAKHLDGYVIELCLPEDGPQLRLQYTDQPTNDYLWMAMERITDSVGYPSVFFVSRHGDGYRWLFSDYVFPDYRWSLDLRVVFRLRKITQS